MREPGRPPVPRGGPAETAAELRATCPVCSPSQQSGPVSLSDLCLDGKIKDGGAVVERGAGSRHPSDLEDEGWVLLCSFPSSFSFLLSLCAFLSYTSARPPPKGCSAAWLRIPGAALTFGGSRRNRFAQRIPRLSVLTQTCSNPNP